MGKPILRAVNHLNYPDKRNRVYCRKYHQIKKIDGTVCVKCPLFNGSLQGMGVECYYDDLSTEDATIFFKPIPDPQQQLMYMSKMLDTGLIPVEPKITENEYKSENML